MIDTLLIRALAEHEDEDEAADATHAQALRSAEELEDLRLQAKVLRFWGLLQLDLKQAKAQETLQGALRRAEASKDSEQIGRCSAVLGVALHLADQGAQAKPHLERAMIELAAEDPDIEWAGAYARALETSSPPPEQTGSMLQAAHARIRDAQTLGGAGWTGWTLRVRSALALLLTLSACASFSTRTTAQPTKKGAIELAVGADAYAAEGRDRAGGPGFELMARYGLTEQVDLAAKLNIVGLELSSKISLYHDYFFAVAVVPSLGFQLSSFTESDTELFIGTLGAPLLLSVNLFGWVIPVLGFKPLAHLSAGNSRQRGDLLFYPGMVAGIRVNLTENFSVFPEVNLHFPYNTRLMRWRPLVWQGGVAFLLTLGD